MTKKDQKRILKRAIEIISRPGVWSRGAISKNRENFEVLVTSKSACRFCAVGAVARAQFELGFPLERDVYGVQNVYEITPVKLLNKVTKDKYPHYGTIYSLNDRSGLDLVIVVMISAIQELDNDRTGV